MKRAILPIAFLAASAGFAGASLAQTPAPFPRPGDAQRPAPPPPVAQPAPPPSAPQQPIAQPGPRQAAPDAGAPNEQTLGIPVYPGADFLVSYDAGKGQRYYLFGTNTPFADIVTYYRGVLKQRGDLVFEQPPIHEFDVGRFREDTMAFPPGVTVKDYTWGGSPGYLNPKRGAEPARYKTIIQIVPLVQ
jgi:hypothetical protein